RADEGWTIDNYSSDIAVQTDASLNVVERIDADFGALSKHGIFRYVPYRYGFDNQRDRVTTVNVQGVSGPSGAAIPYSESRDRGNLVLKIGDPNRTISGRQTYVIRYNVRGVLNPFNDHDELYWNVVGTGWPVPVKAAAATVSLPADGIRRIACFEGPLGADEPCRWSNTAQRATFQASRALASGEDLTVVLDIAKGVVPVAALDLQRKPRDVSDVPALFSRSPLALASAMLVFAAGLVLIVMNWYTR